MKLRRVAAAEVVASRPSPVDASAMAQAQTIVEDVRSGGEAAVRSWATRLGDLQPDEPLVRDGSALERAWRELDPDDKSLLERVAARIDTFARAQRNALAPVTMKIPGGRAGHRVDPVERAGCYAPGGRFPLPSTVLMTAVTARAAGVGEVWVASPRPATITLAAAHVAGANGLLAAGGAQALAALAFGAGVPACDVVVGPGNAWVTAAKQIVSGVVGIDMLAGPSELVVLADESANPSWVAADLLAQAEHDPDALPALVTTRESLLESVEAALAEQLATLPTAEVARAALAHGFAVLAPDLESAISVCDTLAPEHLQVMTRDAERVAQRLNHYGALFVGAGSAEVLGDYGAGPNHTLPTGGGGRFTGGLSVMHFLRVRTWLHIDDAHAAAPLYEDASRLAELEGLTGHQRASDMRNTR